MALWEYKVITSGKGGFASSTMLETYLNQLGKDEWEIIDFRTDAVNSLAFNGLARRPTLRDWTLEAAIAAAAKAETDKLRVELMNKQYAGDAGASADAQSGGAAAATPASGSPDSLRNLRDTDRDDDPEALADEASHGADDWSNLDTYADDLPTFFDAIKTHLRKNQNAPGMSVALNYLAKRWEQPEPDLIGAMKECGFDIPETEEAEPVFLEYEGDLYWVNRNNRGLYFLNTREKPRPKFRIVAGKPLGADDPVHAALAEEHAADLAEKAKRAAEQAERETEAAARRAEREAQRLAAEAARREQQVAAQAVRDAAREAARSAAAAKAANAPAGLEPAATAVPAAGDGGFTPSAESAEVSATDQAALPQGEALLDAIRPQMRRNRNGPGYSGSTTYLAKAFKQTEAAFDAAFAALDLVPQAAGEKPRLVIIGLYVYWVTKDGRGVTWINGRQASAKELGATGAATPETPATAPINDAPVASEDARGEAIFKAVPRMLPPVVAGDAAAPDVPQAETGAAKAAKGGEKPVKAVRSRKPKAADESPEPVKPRAKKRVTPAAASGRPSKD